jgi:HPt (histidine-containing phosphotransfer) domain-containing protein
MAKKNIVVDEDLYEISVIFHQKKLDEIPELLQIVDNKNVKDIEKKVHKIKGVASSYGLDLLATLAKKMEACAHEEKWDEARKCVLEMDDYLKNTEIVKV